ncbi:MAG: Y4bD/Y4pK family protein [Syntrophobacterales bacterium]|nr:Y4bD/Y4pK family protein [Syntrophobacterales bacterium]
MFRFCLWSKPSNAPLCKDEAETFQITHPFHPLHGKTYLLLTYRHTWGEDRVYYHDEAGKLCQVPAGWTDIRGHDPFVAVSAGRSPFRVSDLLELCRLLRGISGLGGREEGDARCVK